MSVIVILSVAALLVIAALLAATRFGRFAAESPGFMVAVGALGALGAIAAGGVSLPATAPAALAQAGFAALAFASAAQLRLRRFARRCPISFRLTALGAPLYLLVCALSAYVMLPHLALSSAFLLGVVLMLNGAAFDRGAVSRTPAPIAVKSAVRMESAAVIALGAPVAVLIAGASTASAPGDWPPTILTLFAVIKGFGLGGGAGLAAALVLNGVFWSSGSSRARGAARRPGEAVFVGASGLLAYLAAPSIGADPVVAAASAGLLWGEQTEGGAATRLALRRFAERAVTPLAYIGLGSLAAHRLVQADMLSIVFALSAVSILRLGARLAALQTADCDKESKLFLAWYGGAPGAASALFILTLTANPALKDADTVLTVGVLAVAAGVLAARLTSQPVLKSYLRQSASARRRRRFAL